MKTDDYQHGHLLKVINMDIFQVKGYWLSIKVDNHYPLGKAFEKQIKTIEYKGNKNKLKL